jgi:UDP-glucose 6-dehydrogenase
MSENKPLIGFIGQGWIGKNYANDFEARGYSTVRYALEEPYVQNKDKIRDCDIVFIAVPTPSTPQGFDASIVESAVSLIGEGKTAVIKSTMLPGMTEKVQVKYPDRIVLISPEFLTEATAAYDAAHPNRNIIGMSRDSEEHRVAAAAVLNVLPTAKFELVCKAAEAEYIKYGGNNWFYFKVLFVNMLYDLTQSDGCDWDVIRDGMSADPRIGASHLIPVHDSGTLGSDNYHLMSGENTVAKGGRGAGGHCFIKDFAAFSRLYTETFPDDVLGANVLRSLECKNIDLLMKSNKDLDLLKGVYGEDPGAICAS